MASPPWPLAGHWNRQLINPVTGQAFANTTYNVYQSDGTTPVTIYTDSARTSTRAQPLTTDSAGNAGFFADPAAGLILYANASVQTIEVLPDVSDLLGTKFLTDGGAHTTYAYSGPDNLKDLGLGAGLASTVTIATTLPNNLPLNWACNVWLESNCQLTIAAATGATIHGVGITTTPIYHPGLAGMVSILCRFNGSGSQADYFITGGLAAAHT